MQLLEYYWHLFWLCVCYMVMECVQVGMVKTKEAREVPQTTRPNWKLVQTLVWRPQRELQHDERSQGKAHQSLQ